MTNNNYKFNVPIDFGSTEIGSFYKAISVSTPVLIDTINATDFRSAEYILQLSQGGNYSTTKTLLVWNLTDIAMNEYGNVSIGTDIDYTIDGSYQFGNLELTITCPTANVTPVTIKYSRALFDS